MSVNEPIEDEVPVPVDRVEETVVTQQPGYEETEQVIHDVAAERRLSFFQAQRTVWTILTVLEVFLGLRFFLKWIAANPDSGFAVFLYGLTDLILAPFAGLVGNPTNGDSIFEVTTLHAMAIYALLFWVVLRVLMLTAYRPSASAITVTRSVHEEKGGDAESGPTTSRSVHEEKAGDAESERTTYTTRSG